MIFISYNDNKYNNIIFELLDYQPHYFYKIGSVFDPTIFRYYVNYKLFNISNSKNCFYVFRNYEDISNFENELKNAINYKIDDIQKKIPKLTYNNTIIQKNINVYDCYNHDHEIINHLIDDKISELTQIKNDHKSFNTELINDILKINVKSHINEINISFNLNFE